MNSLPDTLSDAKVIFPDFHGVISLLTRVGYLRQEDWYRIAERFQNSMFTYNQVIDTVWWLCYNNERPQRSAYVHSICQALLPDLETMALISYIGSLPD